MTFRNFFQTDPDYEVFQAQPRDLSVGKVYKVKRRSDGKDFACHVVQITNQVTDGYSLDLVRHEVDALRLLAECRNVAAWTEDIAFDPKRLVVHLHTDFYPEGDLATFIRTHNTSITKVAITQIMLSLAVALQDCHQKGIYHQDIKPQNVLLSKKKWNGRDIIVGNLANFGIGALSKAASPHGYGLNGYRVPGSPCYMAPESLNQSNPIFTAKSDMFSLGCTMYELCCGQQAYLTADRSTVPTMNSTIQFKVGNSLAPMPAQLLQLQPDMRPDSTTFVRTMKTYYEHRLQKYGNVDALMSMGLKPAAVVLQAQGATGQVFLANAASQSLQQAGTQVQGQTHPAVQANAFTEYAQPSSPFIQTVVPQQALQHQIPNQTRSLVQPQQTQPAAQFSALQLIAQAVAAPRYQGYAQPFAFQQSQGYAQPPAFPRYQGAVPQAPPFMASGPPPFAPMPDRNDPDYAQKAAKVQADNQRFQEQINAQRRMFQVQTMQNQQANAAVLNQAQNQVLNTQAAMIADNQNSMNYRNNLYQENYQNQFAQRQLLQAQNSGNRQLYNQAFSVVEQGGEAYVHPFGQPNGFFYGGY